MTKQTKKGPAFLLKTYDMIQNQRFKQVIAWNDQGKGFFVHDSQKLALDVLPVYFKHSNMHSFIRQLNMYGFNKTRGKKSQNYYFHPLFKKGQKNLIYQMQRKVQKKGSKKQCQAANLSNQNLSIQLQQIEQKSKENKENILQKKVVILANLSSSNKILQSQIRKKVIALLNINKCLILQQFCHLNEVVKINTCQEDDFEVLFQNQNKQLAIKTNQYMKWNLSIWERISAVCQKNSSGKKQINQTQLTISNKNQNNKYSQGQMEEEKQDLSQQSIKLENQPNQQKQNQSRCQMQMDEQEEMNSDSNKQNFKKQNQENSKSVQIEQNFS